jgi:hypothetical protein
MIHKAMEKFYVFVSSEGSLEHFGDNSGGQFGVHVGRSNVTSVTSSCRMPTDWRTSYYEFLTYK